MGKRVSIWGNLMAFGTEYVYELGGHDLWHPHPSGNGIIICNPSHPPFWTRMEGETIRQDYISGTQTATGFIPDDTVPLIPVPALNPLPGAQSEFMAEPIKPPVILGRGF